MSRKFIIISSGWTATQKNSLTQLLRDSPMGWSKYLNDAWFVVDSRNQHTTQSLKKLIRSEISRNARFVIVRVESSWYSGWGPTKLWNWMSKNWN